MIKRLERLEDRLERNYNDIWAYLKAITDCMEKQGFVVDHKVVAKYDENQQKLYIKV